MAMMSKYSIANIPIPPIAALLTANLTPDSLTPSPAHFLRSVLTTTPSIQRRARLLSPPCHFSFVTPFPVPFPYDIEPDDRQNIEAWLSQREPLHPRAPRLYDSKNRDQPAILLGLCQTALRDCLPHLDVGDAFALLGVPNNNNNNNEQQAVSARKELIDVLSGKSVLMNEDFAPWSVRYSGHQFGSWAGQLGDGRATSILVTPHPSDPSLTYELQLKGAGRTPFSRTADGLAVVRSSVREYLCSEAMQALRIPTTRSLSLIALPSLPVQRESLEKASILTRIAPSFLRIGNFEAFNGPKNMFFFGGGQQEPNWEALRILGEWVKGPVLNLHGDAWGRELVMDVARRNAKMVARWQAYGFMHGVINTDNVSVLGLTIDYGPYAFMDVFDSFHICNHTDEGGRYAYKYQPNMIVFALRRLLDALAPLIGAEIENGGKAVQKGWADDASDEKLNEWKELALQKVKDDLEREIQQVMTDEYGAVMRARLGLTRADPSDESKISKPLLDIMEDHKLDFHSTFRTLSYFKPSLTDEESSLKIFVDKILSATPDAQSTVHRERAQEEVRKWLNRYADRIRSEAAAPQSGQERDDKRKNAMLAVNPRFVLRQWVLEEVIKKVEADVAITDHGQEASNNGRRVLAKVLHMACNPYDPWGAEVDPLDQTPAELDAEEQEEKRYCGLGDKKFLGFQCSCSS